jgi:hypothetical protein
MLCREQGRGYGAVDVHDRDRRTGLEHRVQGGFSVPTAPIPDRGGDAHDGGADQSREYGGKRALPTGEREVDLGTGAFEHPDCPQQSVKTSDPDVVRRYDVDPELLEHDSRLFRERDVAGAGGHEAHRSGAKLSAEWPGESNEAAVGEEANRQPVAFHEFEGASLRRSGPRDQCARAGRAERTEDTEQVVHRLALPEHDLRNADPSRSVPVEPREVGDREFRRP